VTSLSNVKRGKHLAFVVQPLHQPGVEAPGRNCDQPVTSASVNGSGLRAIAGSVDGGHGA